MERHSRSRRRHSRGYRRGGRRGSSGRHRHHSRSRTEFRKKKTGGILGFLKRLFGLEKTDRPRQQRGRDRATSEHRSHQHAGAPSPHHRTDDHSPQEFHTPKLYIGNLAYEVSESDLFDLFSQVGAVSNVEIVRDRNMNSKGFGFAEMQSTDTAKAVAEKYNGIDFMGRNLVVSPAKS